MPASLARQGGGWTERLYVYFRVDEADLHAALAALRSAQARLMVDHPGLQAELLRRPELREGQATLMETYAHPSGLDAALSAAIDRAARQALGNLLRGERHGERFERLA